jgi:hypothetical protein
MKKHFNELKNGQEFKIEGKDDTFIRIPFLMNFYRTTGTKRNAKYKISPSRMNDKFIYVEDDETVDVS